MTPRGINFNNLIQQTNDSEYNKSLEKKEIMSGNKKMPLLNIIDKNVQKMCNDQIDDKIRDNFGNILCQNCQK